MLDCYLSLQISPIEGCGEILTISVLPRLNSPTLIIKVLQQRRPNLPTRVQLVSPYTPQLVSFQRVEQQYFVCFWDCAAVVGEVEVHGGDLLVV